MQQLPCVGEIRKDALFVDQIAGAGQTVLRYGAHWAKHKRRCNHPMPQNQQQRVFVQGL